MLTYWDIKNKLKSISRLDLLSATAVGRNGHLINIIKEFKPKNIIEIGTYNGISTVILASMVDHIYTFDIAYRDVEYILNLFNLRHKVSICVAPQHQIDFELKCIKDKEPAYWNNRFDFDFAFIDGEHTEEVVRHDFELVKFCGRVLFHNADWPPINIFLKGIGAKTIDSRGGFGYWQSD